MRKPCADRLERHLDTINNLSFDARQAFVLLIDTAGAHLQAQLDVVESLRTGKTYGKKKVVHDQAYADMKSACIAFNRVCDQERTDGKSPLRSWFARFRVLMGSDWSAFEDLDQLIAETR